jgi:murein DD-endopeptidase MepM/ murein hydrolase activator NlpD
LEESLIEEITESTEKTVDSITINVEPVYELQLLARTKNTDEEEIKNIIKNETTVTYKYYEITLNNETLEMANTLEEAKDLVEVIKDEHSEEELELSILEKYTENDDEIVISSLEVAKAEIGNKANEMIEEAIQQKEEEERINSLPSINGVKLAVTPITGTITSRYAESSRLRVSTHTGLDIAAVTGTPIKVVADGVVTFAAKNGSYGNLVKVDHGNGVETWYAHTNKIYVSVGQSVSAGDVIAEVGSTGNSTGPHLHLEIRIDGVAVNPQQYLYN